jgi:hypothetical protein
MYIYLMAQMHCVNHQTTGNQPNSAKVGQIYFIKVSELIPT